MVDEISHGHRWPNDEAFDDAGGDAAHAVGLAAVVAEGELVEVGLQVLVADRACMRADEPALQQRDRPVASLNGVILAPFGLGLYVSLVPARTEALLVVAGVPVRHDAGVGGDLAVGETLHSLLVIVLDVGEAHPSVCFGRDQHQLLVRSALSPDERFVGLHERAERLAVGVNHRRAQLVQPRPRRLVGTKAHDALQVLARDAGAARRDLEDGAEPHLERLVGFLQKRSGRQARLVAAHRALERRAFADRPDALAVARGAGGLAAPAGLDPVGMMRPPRKY